MKRLNGLVPWWLWMWLVHGVFVTLMYFFYFSRKSGWVKASWSSVSLAHEMNYAVWWAGICLLLAALIFYRIASYHRDNFREALVWLILAAMALTLSIDEIGSLHELVGMWYGWLGLAPFALVLGAAFGYAIWQLLRQKGLRLTAVLVLAAIFLFAAVAGLEFIEHNIRIESKSLQRFRLIGEEATELVGVSLLIIGGLLAMSHFGLREKSIRVLAGRPGDLAGFRELLFILLVVHALMMVTLTIPNAHLILSLHSGNPAALFPLYLFFICAAICFRLGSDIRGSGFFTAMGILFLLTSLGQTYNFNRLFNNVFTRDVDVLTGAPETWLITLVPLFVLSAWLWMRHRTCRGDVLLGNLIVLVVMVLAYPPELRPMNYYLFSATVAYACFRLLDAHTTDRLAATGATRETSGDQSSTESSSSPS